ncbi:arsenate reductase family protein [Clostridium sp. YIM B02555]|uniref:arsenate reductase family protein n=1 Tax=Clostridium sp. YIM B02555 TaxID=2911968 RepID=UPI001EEE5651|nr:arsenate reductase family protein [Clostridium sp. YIM B02555]
MNIQIFGTKKCFDTKKAERFFKERNVKYQLIDINEKAMSKGELTSVLKSVGINDLINNKSKDYTKLNFNNIRSADVKTELLFKNQKVMNTPVVRNGKEATVGYKVEVWSNWIEAEKSCKEI